MAHEILIMLLFGTAVPSEAPSRDDVVEHLQARVRGWSPTQIESLGGLVYERAHAYGLDPELVLAVMSVESSFRFRARSPVDARGLMQVMPSTGRLFARNSGVRWRGARTLYDPEANIRIGTRYLWWLLRKFDGNLPLALTSYCHGIGRVKRDLRSQVKLSRRRLRYSRKVLRQYVRLQRARAARSRSAPDLSRWRGIMSLSEGLTPPGIAAVALSRH